ncbi:DUF1795 domain-containing protein [Leekyejoonella antrihumi]|uniref:DUF1795 domain-containing protein n=1 Tax=Leekyejoonella antrihumi TaxID=1660198 RepID=A0A563DU78_9MICO|nr:DUF1795 domain-containing protein [Leekyejoonella antrihumi]TWP33739.1 DUF1795 domain-containing protein [Leekyejoonella antrihumi]
MNRRRALAFAILPMTASVALAGCQFGSSTPAASSTPSTSTTTTTSSASPTPSVVTSAVKGSTPGAKKAFRVVVPSGWTNTTSAHKSTVMFLQSKTQAGHFYPTFNVIRQQQTPLPQLGDVVQQAQIAMRQGGATVTQVADRTIGGEPAEGYLANRTANGQQVAQTQYFVIHNGVIYTTTMSSDAGTRTQADQTQDGILDTWSWAAG